MLNKEENKIIESIKANPYMQRTIALVEKFVHNHDSIDKKYRCRFYSENVNVT